MDTANPTPARGPVPPGERLEALDVLRGLALLGILLMNARAFLMPEAAYRQPLAWGEPGWAGVAAFMLVNLFASEKSLGLFALLYGVGIVLMAERMEARGAAPPGPHLRRTLALLLIGLAHAYLIWYGDILTLYAVAALAVYPLRRLPAGWLAGAAAVFYGVRQAIFYHQAPGWLANAANGTWWNPTAAEYAGEIAFRRGPVSGQFSWNMDQALYFHLDVYPINTFWLAGAFMLGGMALARAGVFRNPARLSRRGWAVAGGCLLGTGLALEAAALLFWQASGFAYADYLGSYTALHAGATPLLVGGCVAGVTALCRTQALRSVRTLLAAAGRLALTNYLLQTLVGIYAVNALGLFARLSYPGVAALALAVFAVQAVGSWLYLRYFRQGPLEAILRRATYAGASPGQGQTRPPPSEAP